MTRSGPIRRSLRAIRYLVKRKQTYFLTETSFYKILIGPSATAKRANEIAAGSQIPHRWPPMAARILLHQTVLHWPGLVVLRAPIVRGRRLSTSEAAGLAEQVFAADLGPVPKLDWKTAIAPRFVSEVWPRLPASTRQFMEETLAGVQLPDTGCHGDLGAANIIVSDDGTIWIIDWERYREVGSLVEDMSRLLATVAPARPIHIGRIWASGIFRQACERSGFAESQLLLLYIISKARCDLDSHPRRKVIRRLVVHVDELRAAAGHGA